MQISSALGALLVLLFCSNSYRLEAQELNLSLDLQRSDGTLFFLASMAGGGDFSECVTTLKFAKSPGAINRGLGQVVFTFAGTHSTNFPFGFEFKDIDIVFNGRTYIKATLDCGDQFVVDSNVLNKNFSEGKRRFRHATRTSNFDRFTREVKKSVDYGV